MGKTLEKWCKWWPLEGPNSCIKNSKGIWPEPPASCINMSHQPRWLKSYNTEVMLWALWTELIDLNPALLSVVKVWLKGLQQVVFLTISIYSMKGRYISAKIKQHKENVSYVSNNGNSTIHGYFRKIVSWSESWGILIRGTNGEWECDGENR